MTKKQDSNKDNPPGEPVPPEIKITRRGFMKGSIGVAAAGLVGASSVPALKSLIPPPVTRCDPDAAEDRLIYKSQEGEWWDSLSGEFTRKEDLQINQSAIVWWKPKELEEELGVCEMTLNVVKVQTSALTVIIEEKEQEDAVQSISEWGVIDDEGESVVMAFNTYKCPHLCCKPVFVEEDRTSPISGMPVQFNFQCPCHLSLFDPTTIIDDARAADDPNVGIESRPVMVAQLVEGPAPWGLPMVPLMERDGVLVGRTETIDWLKFCGMG